MKRARSSALLVATSVAFGVVEMNASAISAQSHQVPNLAERLGSIHDEVMDLEDRLVKSLRNQKQAQDNLKYIEILIKLQHQERDLGKKRSAELESTLSELEARRSTLLERISTHRKAVHRFLVAVEKASQAESEDIGLSDQISAFPLFPFVEQEKAEAPRRKVLALLVQRGLKEMQVMKIDLNDAENLESQIQDEKQKLAFLFNDLDEREAVLQLNQDLQVNYLRKNQEDRIVQLENYGKLKSAESRVQKLMNDFNARKELNQSLTSLPRQENEQAYSNALRQSVFYALKGKLPLPLPGGKILSAFGKTYDPHSRLYIFKKGIDIASRKNETVRAISSGKLAFSGELPSYGRVAIIDHGDHFYSLCAHLGSLGKRAGDFVVAGEALGSTDDLGTPVYFEIRARNVAVNPLQWVSN